VLKEMKMNLFNKKIFKKIFKKKKNLKKIF